VPIKIDFLGKKQNTNNHHKGKSIKLLMVFASVFAGLIIILIFITIFFGYNQQNQQEENNKQIPSPTPTIIQEINSPSNYATDSALLQIEKRVDQIEIELLETDLKESGLNLPNLNMEIEFEDQ